MRDVAALAGVGLKTVSRVVNAEPNVSAETQARVERAIDALGFEPNLGAGSLRREGGRTLTIGLILDAVDNPFSAAINRATRFTLADSPSSTRSSRMRPAPSVPRLSSWSSRMRPSKCWLSL
jgi:DNA-binding LacI/PurR family transcriptional regulator